MLEGAQLGAYRVLRQIGEGGMGTVWMAEHSMLGRRAALKILHPSFSTRQDIVRRFFNEARAATTISDPGIIQIFDFGFHTDGSAYIVMELLEGEPLDHRLRRRGALPAVDALRICRQVASAVGAAHARGIIHRDLKPENIFMVRDSEVAGGERAKVLDFGIAKLAGDLGANQKTSTSAIIGTPQYMSPEQCRGAGKIDQRTDVYSLGCVLFTLVTGHALFRAEGVGELIVQHMTAPPPRPSTLVLDLPAEIDDLILRCLAKDPADRFACGAYLAAAIDVVLSRAPGGYVISTAVASAPSPPPTTTLGSSAGLVVAPSITTSRGRGALYAAVAALVMIGGVAAVIVASQGSPEPTRIVGSGEPRTPAVTAQSPPAQPPPAQPPPAQPPPAQSQQESLERMPHPGDSRQMRAKQDMQELLAAFSKWAAAHVGAPCPTLAALGAHPDPWGHAYELTCADQPADQVIGVISAGPDGVQATADDLTSWRLGRDVTDLARGKRWPSPTVEPAAPDPAVTTARKPSSSKPPTKKPSTSAARKPASPQIIDLDGDGIPDVR